MTAIDALLALRVSLSDAVAERDKYWLLYCQASHREVLARAALAAAECEAVKDEDEPPCLR